MRRNQGDKTKVKLSDADKIKTIVKLKKEISVKLDKEGGVSIREVMMTNLFERVARTEIFSAETVRVYGDVSIRAETNTWVQSNEVSSQH